MNLIENNVLASKPTNTICLNMIVKNESRIIVRMLNSVVDVIDCYCICDTGSTDNTIEVIQQFFASKNIPGKIIQEPFQNFCYNRTFALKSCVGMSDYVLLMDADMILCQKSFNKNMLGKHYSYSILQGDSNFMYYNIRLVRNNIKNAYVGVTHEYIDIGNESNYEFKHSDIFINDIGDGGCKSDKYQRDIRLLLKGLQDEPYMQPRYTFYLANSYYYLCDYNNAIDYYLKRTKLAGWRQEVWYSYYRIGLCYSAMGKMSDALFYWLEAYNYDPDRLENIYEIINYYCNNNQYKMAALYWECAKKRLNKNVDCTGYLFSESSIYKYKLYYLYTIFGYYTGVKNVDDEFINVLNNCTEYSKNTVTLSNIRFYCNTLKCKNTYIFDDSKEYIINGERENYVSSSSSLIKHPKHDGYLMNIRYVNYTILKDGSYSVSGKICKTLNKFVELDKNLNQINENLIDFSTDKLSNTEQLSWVIEGIEDVRIFFDDSIEELKYIATGYHPDSNKIGVFAGNYSTSGIIEKNQLQQSFKNTVCEKNWVFVNYMNSLHIIYEWYPLTICKINNNHFIDVVCKKQMPLIFSYMRGSSCGFNYKNEIWFVTHFVSRDSEKQYYYHMLSVFDENLNLLRYSIPFKFNNEIIEYCLSIVVEDDRVLINYSCWDKTTRIGIYDKKYIDSIIKYSFDN